MADEPAQNADKPLASLVDAEKQINPPVVAKYPLTSVSMEPGSLPEGHVSQEQKPAVDRLRAFEDETLGKDAPRFNGALERGVGSLWERMPAAAKAHHAKLEKLVETEGKLATAHAALIAADNAHEAALAAVDNDG